MSFVIRKLQPAEEDILEAAIWYEERQVGLGEGFLNEVDRAVRALSDDALHYRIRFGDVRRKPIHRFKFYGIYTWSAQRRFGSWRFSTDGAIRARYKNALRRVADA